MASKFHLASGGIIDFNSSAVTLTHNSNGLRLESNDDTAPSLQITQSGSGNGIKVIGTSELSGAVTVTGNSSLSGEVTITGNSTISGEVEVTGNSSISGAVTITGNSSLSGNTQLTGTLTVGVDDSGHDVKFFGDTASSYMLWDTSTDDLKLAGAAGLQVTGATSLAATTFSGDTSISGYNLTVAEGNCEIKKINNGDFVALTLTNQNSTNTASHGIVSLRFDLHDTNGSAVDSGKIAVKKENAFTSTSSTQDSSMVFSTSLDGTLTEYMTLSSAGQLSLTRSGGNGLVVTGNSHMTGNLAVNGTLDVTGATTITGAIVASSDAATTQLTVTNTTATLAFSCNGNMNIAGNTATTGVVNLNRANANLPSVTFKDTGSSNFVGFLPPTNVSSSHSYKLPNAFPGSNKVLQSTSTGVLSWVSNSGGGGSSTLAGLTDVVTSTDNNQFTNSIALGTNNSAPTFGASLSGATSNIIIGIGGGSSDSPTFALTTGDSNIVLGNTSFTRATTALRNVVIGVNVGNYLTEANDNVLIGQNTGSALTTGSNNVVIGSGAVGNNATTVGSSVILGFQAGTALTTGNKNVLIGYSAGSALTTTGDTVAIGYESAKSTTVGLYNTALGHQALYTNVDGARNTALGYNSLYNMEPGTAQTGNNTAVGFNSGLNVSTGTNNTLLGSESGTNLGSLVTSGTLDEDGNVNKTEFTLENTKVSSDHQFNGNIIKFTGGNNAGEARIIKTTADTNDTITVNDAFSQKPLQNDTYEIYSSIIAHSGTLDAAGTDAGQFTLENVPAISSVDDFYNAAFIKFKTGSNANLVRKIADYTGSSRTVFMNTSGSANDLTATPSSGDTYEIITTNLTTGSNNTFLGFGAAGIGIGDNQTSLGYQSGCSAANQITLGNSSVTALRCADTTIATLSDSRDKENVSDSTYGLSFINSLRPVQYTWNRRHLEEGDENSVLNGKTRLGFLAQELQSAMPNNENEVLDLVYDVNPERLEAKYGNLIPVLVKAIQDLSTANDALVARVTALENA